MADSNVTGSRVVLGDSVPWFNAALLSGGSFDLHVSAGRWVVLSFLGPSADPRTSEELDKLLQNAALFREDHMVCVVVLADRPADAAPFAEISGNSLFFLVDDDGALRRAFGASVVPRTIVLDPMLRAIADIAWDFPQGHAETIASVLGGLPTVDESAGVPMSAPALIVPRVFSFELCDFLVQFYREQSATESGFQLDVDGKTKTILDGRFKRRTDVPVAAAEVRELVRDHIARRLVPQIARYFQFPATRMDRYVVACYDAAVGGHFFRHRDNINAGAQHRRFAVSINLNRDFEGGDLMFPEFGRKLYRPPVGGAVVFSCAALHQVVPVTRGCRFAFLSFIYGEEDVKTRLANNVRLHEGETHYRADRDRLFPAETAPLAADVAA
jgi:predicted 2-oxoglutarate/Fe(II)-dependent dioxygenase YbiX/peroxiredoxin